MIKKRWQKILYFLFAFLIFDVLCLVSPSSLPSSTHPTIPPSNHPTIRGLAPQSAIITIECERGKIIYPLQPINNMSWRAEGEATSEAISSPICYKDKKLKEVLKSNYENANNKIILKRKVSLKEGKFNLNLRIPENIPPGRYFIKCYLCGKEKDAFGYFPFRVTDTLSLHNIFSIYDVATVTRKFL